jgi:hypothetical protein
MTEEEIDKVLNEARQIIAESPHGNKHNKGQQKAAVSIVRSCLMKHFKLARDHFLPPGVK